MLLNPGGEKGEGSGEGGKRRRGKSGESTDGSAGGNSFEGIGIGPIIACVASVRFNLRSSTKELERRRWPGGQLCCWSR